jgi:hypothetical protein
MIIRQSQVVRIVDNKDGIQSIRFFFLVDCVDDFEYLGSDQFIISINRIDNFSQTTILVRCVVKTK